MWSFGITQIQRLPFSPLKFYRPRKNFAKFYSYYSLSHQWASLSSTSNSKLFRSQRSQLCSLQFCHNQMRTSLILRQTNFFFISACQQHATYTTSSVEASTQREKSSGVSDENTSSTQPSMNSATKNPDKVTIIQADFNALLSQVRAHMPPFDAKEFQRVCEAVRELKRVEGALPTSQQALTLLYGYLHLSMENTRDSTTNIQNAWIAYNDVKASLYQEKSLPLVNKYKEKIETLGVMHGSRVQQQEELALKRQLLLIGPDKHVYDTLLLQLALYREFDFLNKVFKDMQERTLFTPSIYRAFEPDLLTFNILLAAFAESGNVAGALFIYNALFDHKIIPEVSQLELILKSAAIAGDCRTFARFFYRLDHKNQRLDHSKLRYLIQNWGQSLRLDWLRQQKVKCKDITLTLDLVLRIHNYAAALTLISLLDDLGLRIDAVMVETFLRACLRDRFLPQEARALRAKLRYVHHYIDNDTLLNEVNTFIKTRIPEHIQSLGLPLTQATPLPFPPSPPVFRVTRRKCREQYISPQVLERYRTRQRYVSMWSDDEKLFLFVPEYKARLEAEKRRQQLAQQNQQLQTIAAEVDKELLQTISNPLSTSSSSSPPPPQPSSSTTTPSS